MVAGRAAAPAQRRRRSPGIWQEQKIELAYLGFTSHYSCDGLQSKLELLLRQLGAQPGCESHRLWLRSRLWDAEPFSAGHAEIRHAAAG